MAVAFYIGEADEDGNKIEVCFCHNEQPVKTASRGTVRADQLVEGDHVVTINNGPFARITSTPVVT
jgi:hypothetical protein